MVDRLSQFIIKHWLLVLVAWLVLVVVLRAAAPSWDAMANDGTLEYLPSDVPSVQGEQLLEAAFPYDRSKSQIVVVVAREDRPLESDDVAIAYDLARRFTSLDGAAAYLRAQRLLEETEKLRRRGREEAAVAAGQRAQRTLQKALASLDHAVYFDESLVRYFEQPSAGEDAYAQYDPSLAPPRLASALHNRALVLQALGDGDLAQEDRRLASLLDPTLRHVEGIVPPEVDQWPLLDVWTWEESIIGRKLKQDHARLIILQLSNEFMATDNVRVLEQVEAEIAEVQQLIDQFQLDSPIIGLSGSAAVGGDMRRAAADSIRNTELFTVLLVLLILTIVYRSPLLIALPVISIGIALLAATSLVALLVQLGTVPGFDWWTLKIFTTSKIFVVVIMFGAGTDYCLFLISRYKEELQHGFETPVALRRAMNGVGDALIASALTTVIGLSMMFFADFGQFRYTGPVIGLCLLIALLTCLTLTPAMLRLLGRRVFWPSSIARQASPVEPLLVGRTQRFWHLLARNVVAYPGRVLIASVLLMMPLAGYGVLSADHVTYDFASDLPAQRPAYQGTELLKRHFPIGETGPLTVLVRQDGAEFAGDEGRKRIAELTDELYVEGIRAVRSLSDPLGDFGPGEKMGLLRGSAWSRRLLQPHDRTEELFVAQAQPMAGSVARFELILEDDPFSIQATQVLQRVDQRLHELAGDSESFWHAAQFAYAGTTAGIRDLRAVTQADNARIQVLVVVAVFTVLLLILRRPGACLYMILTVLFSYYVTLGVTQLFFAWAFADTYQGLDWKVPLFLFVILVAVGQDYNVYLATRVFEEQQRYGPFDGLRRAMVQTGGIITSCGVIMAGTFLSMTSGSWVHVLPAWMPGHGLLFQSGGGVLRGIAEMGFALSLGVLLDTLVVRSILVPAFFSIQGRWEAGQQQRALASRLIRAKSPARSAAH